MAETKQCYYNVIIAISTTLRRSKRMCFHCNFSLAGVTTVKLAESALTFLIMN